MGSFGIKVSQPGVDVRKAADYQLSMSSGWPRFNIHKTGTIGSNDSTTRFTIPHELPYTPAFILVDNINFEPTQQYAMDFNESQGRVNGTNLILDNFGQDSSGDRFRMRYYIFEWPLEKEFSSPIINAFPGQIVSGKSDVGVKIPLDNTPLNSDELRKFSYHSNARSPLIHKSGASKGNDNTIYHHLGYEPLVLVWYLNPSDQNWLPHPMGGGFGGNTYSTIDADKITFGATFTDRFAYIILKDPISVVF